MRGRKPKRLQLKSKDAAELHKLLRDRSTPQLTAQRARLLLARASDQRVG